MISTTLYALGLLCRFGALVLACRLLWIRFSWRLVVVALGVVWISVQPIIQYFFSASINFISTVQKPEVFFLASIFALFAIYQLYEYLVDNERFSQKASSESERFGRRQSILLELSKLRGPNLNEILALILKSDAEELNVARTSIWLFNDDRSGIESLVLYDQGVVSTEPVQLLAKDYPAYFSALDINGIITADDARTHPATREFEPDYLQPNNIFALLDVPIRIDGGVQGIICHENLKSTRHWTEEDQDFAHSIADLCALAISSEKQRQTEAELQESRRHLVDAQNTGEFGSFRWDLKPDLMLWSGQVMTQLGFTNDGLPQTERFRSRIVETYLPQYDDVLRKAFKDEKPFRTRLQLKPEFGGQYFEVRGSYLNNERFKGGCFEGTVHNITEQVEAEQEKQRLEEQLIQSQKMESIGTLAGGIAHDFNNILTPILGYTDVALAELGPDSPIRPTLEEVLHGSLRAKDLVEQILIFSRRWDEKTEPLDLEDSIQSGLKLLRPTLPSSIKIEVDITPGHKLVEADSTQMVQVLLNLCTNAWHSMEPAGGLLSIHLYPTSKNGTEMTAVSVSDTGIGIDAEALGRIFDPFFTTKDVGKGTGLGLSVVHGIISKHGGEIVVDSKPGATTFTIFMPTTDKLPSVLPPPIESAGQREGSILLVDDDEAVARILESMLSDLGYRADVHLSGNSALASFQRSDRQYDLLLTDLTMPSMSGIELTHKIREIDPDLPVLIVSGYGEAQVNSQLIGLEHCHIVTKPIIKADLATALKKELH
tara:strand:+ start:6727 stop:9039 length:2313 start_codon:yes stop_codon:yes gene_type:complete